MRRRPVRSAVLSALLVLAAGSPPLAAQWTPLRTGTGAEFRGLSAAGARVVWAAGKGGVVARSVDGGATWRADTIPGATSLFLVDVHAVGADTAYVLGTSFVDSISDGRIYRTTDGGRHWTLQYRDTTKGMFLDGLAFWDARHGVAFGDPVGGSFVVLTTADGGATWRRVPPERLPPPLPGEASFAASGTAITTFGDSLVWFGTGGGEHARVYRSTDRGRTWSVSATPLPGGKTAGLFGIAFRDARHGVAVGGDYTAPAAAGANVLRTSDGGVTWSIAGTTAPAGVRYGVVYVPGAAAPALVATGPSGSGYSTDDGATWTAIGTAPYNTVVFAAPAAGWAAGTDGRIGKWAGRPLDAPRGGAGERR